MAKQTTHFEQHGSHYAHNFVFWECDKLSQRRILVIRNCSFQIKLKAIVEIAQRNRIT